MKPITLMLTTVLLAGSAGTAFAHRGATTHAIGGGTTIALPAKWRLQASPVSTEGMHDYRVQRGGTTIVIRGIPTPGKPLLGEEAVRTLLQEGTRMYHGIAVQEEAVVTSLSAAGRAGGHVSLTARPGTAFKVLPDDQHEAFTHAIVNVHGWLYTVSIATHEPDSAEYRAAIKALASIR